MSSRHSRAKERRMWRAAAELQALILERYPEATFKTYWGQDPCGLHVRVIVDVEDPEEVLDVVIDRMLDIQIEEHLPVYVFQSRPLERVLAEQRKGD